MTRRWSGLVVLAAVLTGGAAGAAEPAEVARRHFLRGMAAIELAKDDADLEAAIEEFRLAAVAEPGMAGAWFNLAAVQVKLGRFEEAISHYQRYLVVAPQAEDAARVRDELVKLEFRLERTRTAKGRAGTWIGNDGTHYQLTVDGDKITLQASNRWVTVADVKATYTLVGALPVGREVQTFQLTVRGDVVQGTWRREPIKADQCTVPEEGGEAKGRLSDPDSRLVIRYTRNSYEAPTQMSIFESDHCRGVTVTRKRELELVLRGPVAEAGLSGVRLSVHEDDLDGWSGPLRVVEVAKGSAAEAAGLREKDVVLGIDGVDGKDLSQGEWLWRLRGKPGAVVKLQVLHQGEKEPVAVALALEAGFSVP
jgi:hypothetical protein